MAINRIGIVSPGRMGRSLALSLNAKGHKTYFARYRRKHDTIKWAKRAGLQTVATLKDLVEKCDTIICVGTEGIAFEAPREIFGSYDFKGLYIDFNTLNSIGEVEDWRLLMDALEVKYVEGRLEGSDYETLESGSKNRSVMYLSGEDAHLAAELFKDTRWEIKITPNAKTDCRKPFQPFFSS